MVQVSAGPQRSTMSMFKSKLVTCIKVAGKVLKEQKNSDGEQTVQIPFGSEYSIYLKNLNSVRALVRVSIDGQSVTDGEDLVIHGNSELDLERFLKKGNMDSGNRLKFIERTSRVENHRGIGAEDGIVRVEFQFEKVPPKVIHTHEYHHHHHDWYDYPWKKPYYPYYPWYNNADVFYGSAGLNNVTMNVSSTIPMSINACDTVGATSASLTTSNDSLIRSMKADASIVKCAVPNHQFLAQAQSINDQGITVAGSVSNQKFQAASWFPVEDEKFVICLKLLGHINGSAVEQPVLVKKKQTCSTCGTRNRGSNAFCRHCGTALELVGQSKGRVSVQK